MKVNLLAAVVMTVSGALYACPALAQATEPRFETVTEIVEIDEPRLVWKKGANLSGVMRADPRTGEIHSLVEEPHAPAVLTRKILVVEPDGAPQAVPVSGSPAAPEAPDSNSVYMQAEVAANGLDGAPGEGQAEVISVVTPLPKPVAIDAAPQQVAKPKEYSVRKRLAW